MGDSASESEDPYAAANVAPVVAWLLSDAAHVVSGRVFEVGGDRVSIADGWRPGAEAPMARGVPVHEVGSLIEGLLEKAQEPERLGRPDPALLAAS
jgi:hypothetical protein